MLRNARVLAFVLVPAGMTAGCSLLQRTTAPHAKVPQSLVLVQGGSQVGQAGRALPTPVVFRAVDSLGVGMSGVTVTLAVVAGGGSVTPSADTTNAHGEFSTTWTLGPNDISQQIVGTAEGVGAVPVSATGLLPAQIVLVQGNNQSAKTGTAVVNAIVVRVVGGANVPMQGVTVGFQILTGGGGMSLVTVVTNALGEATTKWTLGAVGPQTASVVAGALAPVQLTATATP